MLFDFLPPPSDLAFEAWGVDASASLGSLAPIEDEAEVGSRAVEFGQLGRRICLTDGSLGLRARPLSFRFWHLKQKFLLVTIRSQEGLVHFRGSPLLLLRVVAFGSGPKIT